MPELSANYSRYVRRTDFRRRLFGYRPADVDAHLQTVSGWFSLTGLDKVLEERGRELQEQADRRLAEAEGEASRVLADARRDADEIRAAAEQDARLILERARREAALERRGRSRLGRPLGRRANPG
jgi:DivIVA domain-containing protein